MVCDSPHAPKRVLHLDFANRFTSMTLDFFEELSFCRYGFFQSGLEVWFGGGGIASYRWYRG